MAELALLSAAGAGAGAGAGLGAGAAAAVGSGAAVGAGSAAAAGATAGLAGTAAAGSSLGSVLATAALAGTTTSGVVSSVSAQNAAEAQSKQAEINARQIRAANEIEAERERARGRARAGALEARIGASGTTRAGSALSLIGDELFQSTLNEAIVLAQGGQAVTRQRNIASSTRSRGRSVLNTGLFNSVASGINVGSRVGSILQ